jgi:hypothetical protein
VSPARWASSITATIRSAAAASADRTGERSMASRSPGPGSEASSAEPAEPIRTTCDRISMPSSARKALQK